VLAGTLGGLSILDDAAVRENLTLKNSGLTHNWITALAHLQPANAPEQWFVGTYGGSVEMLDAAGHITPMSTPAPAAVINPNAMLTTSRHVFAGTLDNGLLVYDLASQRWSEVIAGLPSRNVTALAERNGELYVGTENGIVRIREVTLP
jgi:ligand-binding sensor domain-containing protein